MHKLLPIYEVVNVVRTRLMHAKLTKMVDGREIMNKKREA